MALPDFYEEPKYRPKASARLDTALRAELYRQLEKYAERGSIAGMIGGIILGGGAGAIHSGLEGAAWIGVMGIWAGYYAGKAIGYNRGDRKINQEAEIKYSKKEALLIAEYLTELDKLR